MGLIDSHCHLNSDDFKGDLEAVLARARAHGLDKVLTISTSLKETHDLESIAERFPEVYRSVGVHPHEVEADGVPDLKMLESLTQGPKVVALGETGLDYYYDHSKRDLQKDSFRVHIRAAKSMGLPLVIHSRDAEEDILTLLLEENIQSLTIPGVIHCFTGTESFARATLEMGFYISISGVITFKKADALRETVLNIPLDRLLVETDAPWLAPVPMRGKRNEPSYVAYTAAALADLKGVSITELTQITTSNFYRVFSKVTP